MPAADRHAAPEYAMRRAARRGFPVLVAAAVTAGCGSSHSPGFLDRDYPHLTRRPPHLRVCSGGVAQTFVGVALRVYNEAVAGRPVRLEVLRLESSAPLARAVASGNGRAARAALSHLLNQVVRIRVTRGSHLVAASGNHVAIAPVQGTVGNPSGPHAGHIVLSALNADSYVSLVSHLTGAEVLVREGDRQIAGTLKPGPPTVPIRGPLVYRGRHYQVFSFEGRAFGRSAPAPARISLLMPAATPIRCAKTGTLTETAALGYVAERIYQGEVTGPRVDIALAAAANSRKLQRAAVRNDPALARAGIVQLFRNHLHVVRVQVLRGSQLVADVGGVHSIGPIPGPLGGPARRVAGHVVLSVQDDLGLILLIRRFTGADVIIRQGSRLVRSTIRPGPSDIPDLGQVSYKGHQYEAFSFNAQGFPSGTLRVSLLLPRNPATLAPPGPAAGP